MVKHRPGVISTFDFEGTEITFFVKDALDEIQKYHYAGGFYEAEELQIIRRYYRPGSVFVDMGANIGNHSIFAEKILRAPEVIVFEPNPVAIEHMKLNLFFNLCTRVNTQFLGFPLSGRVGDTMTIMQAHENNIGHTVFGNSDTGEFRTITGDFALSRKPVGFIKIDTEEMEFEVLSGLRETLMVSRPCIFIEIVESREQELSDWAVDQNYKIAESQKRYLNLKNYVLTPL